MSVRTGQWADDEVDQPQIISNQDGTKTIITYRTNDEGKKIKVTQKIRDIIVKETVNKSVASRKKWAKFGNEKNSAPGPDIRTTQVGEPVYLRLGTSWKALDKAEEEKAAGEQAKATVSQTVKCRTCGGAHFTSKCPFKDTLGATDAAAGGDDANEASAPAASGRYVPSHLRNGGVRTDQRDRDDSCTLKIMQLNEMVTEEMVREELLAGMGYVVRCNILRNRETGRSRGMAFVQFASEDSAKRAMDSLNGRGYHNLILHIEWSKPKPVR